MIFFSRQNVESTSDTEDKERSELQYINNTSFKSLREFSLLVIIRVLKALDPFQKLILALDKAALTETSKTQPAPLFDLAHPLISNFGGYTKVF